MSIFDNKKKTINRLNEIEQRVNNLELNPRGVIDLENKIEAQESVINSQINLSNAIYEDVEYSQWILINQWANYFTNRFQYEAKDNIHNIIINQAIRNGFIYGRCGVWNNNGTPQLCFRKDIREATTPKDEIEIYLLSEDSIANFISNTKLNKMEWVRVKSDEVIWYQFDSLAYGAFIILKPIIKTESLIQRALYNELLTIPTRLIHDVDISTASKKLAQQFISFRSPVMHRFEGGTDDIKGLTLATNTQNLIDCIEYTKNWYYDMLGRRSNTDFKNAHVLESEVQASSFNTIVIERDRYMFLKKFLQDYSRLFNTKIVLENINGNIEDVFSTLETTKETEEANDEA